MDKIDTEYIEFDLDEVKDLKQDYIETIQSILALLPDINWNSRIETKNYFMEEYSLELPDCKISTLIFARDAFDPESDCFHDLQGVIELYKLKAIIKNYLECIERHHVDGKVYLREMNGEWVFPNRQPVPQCPEILSCLQTTT